MLALAWFTFFWALAISAASGISYARAASLRRRRQARPAPPSDALATLRVALVRPCRGAEPWLEECLQSSSAMHSSSRLETVFAVDSRGDPAAPIAEAACRVTSGRLVVTSATAPNHKADQIARALASCAELPDVVVIADSDVDLAGVDLDQLVAPIVFGVAACWAPPVEGGTTRADGTMGDRASRAILTGSLHAFPLLVGIDPGGMVGKLVAIDGPRLTAVGGFAGLVDTLGEDMELARRLRAKGGAIEMAPMVAQSRATGRTFDAAAARFARWLCVIRSQRPALLVSYPLMFAGTPLVIACSVAGAFASWSLAAASVVVALTTRLWVAGAARKAAGLPPSAGAGWAGSIIDAVLADAMLLRAFGLALLAREVTWRQRTVRFAPGGRIR